MVLEPHLELWSQHGLYSQLSDLQELFARDRCQDLRREVFDVDDNSHRYVAVQLSFRKHSHHVGEVRLRVLL